MRMWREHRCSSSASPPIANVSVTAGSTRRTFLSRCTFLLLGLAFCVFNWGLQYKLSLYDPPQAVSHEMPQAKLLSKDEQSLTGRRLLANDFGSSDKALGSVSDCLVFALLLALALPRLLELSGRYRPIDPSIRPFRRASLTAFFFRPPPVLA